MSFCPECGIKIEKEENFCRNCGTTVITRKPEKTIITTTTVRGRIRGLITRQFVQKNHHQ